MKRIPLSYPYPPETEQGYLQSVVRAMYKSSLVIFTCILLFLVALIAACLALPAFTNDGRHLHGLLAIHGSFLACTAAYLLSSILMRQRMYERPRTYFIHNCTYAIAILIWSSLLSAYVNYSEVAYTAFIYVSLCASLLALFRPWQTLIVFPANFLLYAVALYSFGNLDAESAIKLANGALAVCLSIIICIAFFHSRTSTYYNSLVIRRQSEQIGRINQQLQSLVHTDPLTGLYNRRFFDEVLPGNLAHLQAGGAGAVAIMVDVDYFKKYNDQYGHQAGDICLRRVADILHASLPKAGFAVRYGGEEFFLLAEATGGGQGPLALAEAARHTVEDAFIEHLAAPAGRVTLSLGVALAKPDESLQALAARADAALYTAKQAGRNQSVLAE